MKNPLTSSVAALIALTLTAFGENIPLQQATVNRTLGDVKLVDPKCGTHPAKIDDVVKDDIGVKTGVKSRCELKFQDNTLTRLGSETYFSFKPGTREMSLSEGTMLLQVPKNQGGATIRTASITASITGTTVMLEHRPNKSIKFLVLEGSMRVGTGRLGENISLTPGKMIIMNPNDKKLPDPVNVDLKKLIKTSTLVNPAGFDAGKGSKTKDATLPSMPLINQAIKEQDLMRGKGELIETNLAILGKGTNVIAADESTMEKIDTQSVAMDGIPPATEQAVVAKPVTPPAETVITPKASTAAAVEIPQTVPLAFTTTDVGELDPQKYSGTTSGEAVVVEESAGTDTGAGDSGSGTGGGPGTDAGGFGTGEIEAIIVPRTLSPNVAYAQPAAATVPDWNVAATAQPSVTFNPTPAANGNLTIQSAKIDLLQNPPTLSGGATNFTGTTYAGAANDGSASWFLFGGVTDFEAQVGFDKVFGYGSGNTFAGAGVAVFKGTDVSLGGSLTVTPAEQKDLAIVAQNRITSANAGFSYDLSNLNSLTLATGSGNLVFGQNTTITATGDTFKFLHLHSRGGELKSKNDSLELSGVINLPNAALIASGNEDTSFRLSSVTTVHDAFVSAGDEAEVFGTFTAVNATFNARTAVEFGGVVDIANLTVNSKDFEVRSGSVVVDTVLLKLAGGFLPGGKSSMTETGDAQNPNDNPIFTFKNLAIEAAGNVYLNTLDEKRMRLNFEAAENFSVKTAGRVSFSGDRFVVPARVNATLEAGSLNARSSSTSVSGFDSIKTSGNVDAYALSTPELTVGGNLAATGLVSAQNAQVTGSVSGTTFEFQNAVVGGNVSASERMTANNITVGGSLSGKDFNLGTATVGGVVNSVGTVNVSQLTVGGNLTAESLTGNSAMVGGSATVKKNLSISNFSVNGSLAVGKAVLPSTLNSPNSMQYLLAGSFKAGDGFQFRGADGGSGASGGSLALGVPDTTTIQYAGIAFSSSGVKGANFDGGDATSASGKGGNGGNLLVGTTERPFNGIVTIEDKITATTGKNGNDVEYGGAGGRVSVVANGKVGLKGEITVSDDKGNNKSRSAGNIYIESRKTSGTAIEISSSAQLNSLLSMFAPGDGGRIELKSSGGLIVANGGTIRADRGTVSIENRGTGGSVTLNNTQIAANTVKVSALGNDGTLTIGGGVLKANVLLNMYAAGSNGKIVFSDSTKLDGLGAKVIAANTVTIANGKTVTVGGLLPAGVFTNNANFTGSGGNGSTSGKFDGAGAVKMPFGNAPSL